MIAQLTPVSALLASTFFMLAGIGLGGVLVPLRATLEGWDSTDIAWVGTSYAFFFTLGCIVMPYLVRRVGHIRVFAALQTLLAMSFLLHAMAVHPLAWALIRGLGGFATAGAYMVLESWLNEKVSNENRGAIFSAYMIISMIGVATGQYIMPFGDAGGMEIFMIVAMLFSVALLPTALTSAQAPVPLARVSLDLKGLYLKSPAAVVGAFLTGIVNGVWMFFAPVFGKDAGLSSTGIATMLACAMVGGAVAQFPFGRLSDRIDRRYAMILGGLLGLFVSIFMWIVQPENAAMIFAGMFLFGAAVFPIYALNVAHANDMAEPEEFVKVSSGLLVVFGAGNIFGPQLSGRLMDIIGPSGFFVAAVAGFGLYAAHTTWRLYRREASDLDDRQDFRVLPVTAAQTPETVHLDARIEEVPEDERQRDEEEVSMWGYEFN
ncbi:MAG: MFS transporter [Rhizobiaceae bacterium]